MFGNVEWSDARSSDILRQTCTRTCAILWGITKPAEQNGNFIMIAAAISGHNYQRWLIHFLIASFNLFIFGAKERQAGANEICSKGVEETPVNGICMWLYLWWLGYSGPIVTT